jgi:hypothetical protein
MLFSLAVLAGRLWGRWEKLTYQVFTRQYPSGKNIQLFFTPNKKPAQRGPWLVSVAAISPKQCAASRLQRSAAKSSWRRNLAYLPAHVLFFDVLPERSKA